MGFKPSQKQKNWGKMKSYSNFTWTRIREVHIHIIQIKVNREGSQREQWVMHAWQILTTVLQEFRMGHSGLWLQLTYMWCCQKITLKCLHKIHPHIILFHNHQGKGSWPTYHAFNPSTAHSKMKTNPWHTSVSTEQQHLFLTFSRTALVVLHLNLGIFKLSIPSKIKQCSNFHWCS